AYARSGIYSLAVGNRETTDAAAGCDLDPTTFLNGNTYYVKAPVLVRSSGNGQASVIVESTSGTQVFSTPLTAFNSYTWTDLAGQITPTWSGQLIRATLTVTLDTTSDYYTDSVTLYDVTYPADHYVIDRKLLSPEVNPFGSQQTNPQGIYVIDCATKKITIANSRIVGTVVLVNPSASSIVRGSIQWEPAVPNYPALLADSNIIISPSAAALSESTMNTNFNPAGSPYPYVGGSSNLTAADAYPSVIRGLVYSRQDLLFQGQPTIEGVVIANRDITATGAVMNVRYKSTWYNDPPPGFDADRGKTLQAVAGTWKRTVD
ncbi:MAG: hypothetical protein IMZ65_04135, partial [Planctomycetes bacterium]|nr:hypothetical protein [Planctomycetota bacterium]